MKNKLEFRSVLLACSALTWSAASTEAYADVTASNSALGSTIAITASSGEYAGAVDSLTFRGVQYIQNNAHGRSLQSSANFDGYAECYNPTEAGSERDGSTSSSVLKSISATGNALQTSTQMAFYLQPGQTDSAANCGNGVTVAQNTTILSNFILSKTVTIGFQGIANLTNYSVNFYAPENHQTGTFEAVADYMQTNFSSFLTYDPSAKVLTPHSATLAGQLATIPVIAATSNASSAMGIMSTQIVPGNSANNYFSYSYQSSNFSKENCVFNQSNVTAGSNYSYSCPLAVGNGDEVISAINAYYNTGNTEMPVYRSLNGASHLWSLSYVEGPSKGYSFEGTAWHMFPSSDSSSFVPLYRCYRSGSSDHFASTQSNCEGQTVEGILGYMSTTSASGKTALYRFVNNGNGDHLITTNYNEGTSLSGETYEGILGYVGP